MSDAERLDRVEDLLTDEEKRELNDDLQRIHKIMYPCWDRAE